MKKQFFRAAVVRRVANKMVLTAFVLAAGYTANAQTAVKQPITITNASVQYIGSQEDMISVAVKYDTAPGNKFSITVRDQDGYQLYQGNFTEKKFRKIFELPKPDLSKVIFVIRNTNTNEVQSYEVNTRVVEEIVVKKVG